MVKTLILKVFLMIFGVVGSGEILDFVWFARSRYRSGVLWFVWMKCLGNADFTRGLWIEQMCPFRQSNICSKM